MFQSMAAATVYELESRTVESRNCKNKSKRVSITTNPLAFTAGVNFINFFKASNAEVTNLLEKYVYYI